MGALVGTLAAAAVLQAAASGSRESSSFPRGGSAGAPGPCPRCPSPENGSGECFINQCEIRCFEGYVLQGDACVVDTRPSRLLVEPGNQGVAYDRPEPSGVGMVLATPGGCLTDGDCPPSERCTGARGSSRPATCEQKR